MQLEVFSGVFKVVFLTSSDDDDDDDDDDLATEDLANEVPSWGSPKSNPVVCCGAINASR